MKNNSKLLWICAVTGLLWTASSCTDTASQTEIDLIPKPQLIEMSGGTFTLKDGMSISYSDASLKPAAEYLAGMLGRSTGYKLSVGEGDKGDIRLALTGDSSSKPGSYTLEVKKGEAVVSASGYQGIIAGIETMRQLLPAAIESSGVISDGTWTMPAVSIADEPRFQWRGLMLDVSRHFYTKEEVEELLDLMALYKMNKFHWHLTDDQGWRVEIKQYPLLTEKGAWRTFNSQDRECMRLEKSEHNLDFGIPESKIRIVEGDTLYGGYYTQEDIKEVVKYAAVRGIDIIPEIDMPGHMLAAVSNYSGVSCFPNTGWGKMFSSPVCPGKDSALEFCKKIYAEIFTLFPYKYVHLGADEVEKDNWKKCPDCQRRMRENGLKTEEELQSWFVHQMEHFFNENGKELIGWDEIIEGGLSETATVMWWRNWNPQAVPTATAHGNSVIYCPNADFYLDNRQDKYSVSNIYHYQLAPDSLSEAQRALVLGVQGNIWCERIPSRERMQYMAFPRMMAIAEIGWTDPAHLDWTDFEERMIGQFPRLGILNVNYRMPDLTGFHTTNAFVGETEVKISSPDPGVTIHYTTDGSIPTQESAVYSSPLKITESTDFTFRSFRANGKAGDLFRTSYIKQEYAPASDAATGKAGLQAIWHEGKVDSCAFIERNPLKGTYEVDDVTIPGAVKGDIGLIIKGYFKAPADGVYTFVLLSDDGSTLKVDNEMVVDNDGPHSPQEISGQRALAKGLHPIEVRYFDNNGGTLRLDILDPSGKPMTSKQEIFVH